MRKEVQDDHPQEFWDEERREQWPLLWRQISRWAVLFSLLFAFVYFAFWWAGSAIHFSASRVTESTGATWKIFGTVRNAATGAPIPWAQVEDDPSGRPPLHASHADPQGNYTLKTLAEPHTIRAHAPGFQTATRKVGRPWYMWMPTGEEQWEVVLQPDPR